MNFESLNTAKMLVQSGRVIVFGGQSLQSVPVILQQLANTGKTFTAALDLGKEITYREIENANAKEDFLLFNITLEAGNNFAGFSPSVTAGAFQALIENGGSAPFVVTSKDVERDGQTRTYFQVAPAEPPIVTRETVAQAIENCISLQKANAEKAGKKAEKEEPANVE